MKLLIENLQTWWNQFQMFTFINLFTTVFNWLCLVPLIFMSYHFSLWFMFFFHISFYNSVFITFYIIPSTIYILNHGVLQALNVDVMCDNSFKNLEFLIKNFINKIVHFNLTSIVNFWIWIISTFETTCIFDMAYGIYTSGLYPLNLLKFDNYFCITSCLIYSYHFIIWPYKFEFIFR